MPRTHHLHQVRHSSEQLLALVTDTASYSSFVPLCKAVSLIASEPNGAQTLRLDMSYKGFNSHFTTTNTPMADGAGLLMTLVESPLLERLEGHWRFSPLSEGEGCHVELLLDWELKGGWLAKSLGGLMGQFFDGFVASFLAEARRRYGTGE